MRKTRPLRTLSALCLAALAGTAAAQDTLVIYRCTDGAGAVTVQNDLPCPRGSRQERRVVTAAPGTAPATRPAAPPAGTIPPAGTPTTPAPSGSSIPSTAPATSTTPPLTTGVPTPARDLAAAPPAAATDRRAPPQLFECRTGSDSRYLSENGNPAPRCAPLQTSGIGGPAAATGSACEVVTDRCERVPDAALCDRWRERLRELESALTFGRLDDVDTARVEVDRVRGIVTDSVCGAP